MIRKFFNRLFGRTDLLQQIDRLRVQLAGCSVAAQGGSLDLSPEAYGYSMAFSDVVQLWKRVTKAEITNREMWSENVKMSEELATLRKYKSTHLESFGMKIKLR